jgi:alpha-tubulin suppressor-like RCC1 family protein
MWLRFSIIIGVVLLSLFTPAPRNSAAFAAPLSVSTPVVAQPAAAAVAQVNNIIAIDAGTYHTCAVTNISGVECWGNNTSGQLGNSVMTQSSIPVSVQGLNAPIQQVATGSAHTCALTDAGGVLCWGSNSAGQLGNGTTTPSASPVNVSGLSSGVFAITAGNNYTCAVLGDASIGGTVKCWGYNNSGQLGTGSTVNSSIPLTVPDLNKVTAISAKAGYGSGHTCVITSGSVKCWGLNSSGQLGNNSTIVSFSPVQVSGISDATSLAVGLKHTCAVTSAGLMCWGALGTSLSARVPVLVSEAGALHGLTGGGNFSCGLTTTDGVQCWGDNTFGTLGNGGLPQSATTPQNVTGLAADVRKVVGGLYHACALTTTGTVQCWGSNAYGQLGDGTPVQRAIPIQVPGLIGIGSSTRLAPSAVHTCALIANHAQCWGANLSGVLGDGSYLSRSTPGDVIGLSGTLNQIGTGTNHSCVLSGNSVWCWGNNSSGQLGNGSNTSSNTPVQVQGITTATTLAVGADHNCAVLADHTVQCWGANNFGQLGDNTKINRSQPVAVNSLTDVESITAGVQHSCAVTQDGHVKCWGDNTYGQLGDGSQLPRLTPVGIAGTGVYKAVSAGREHTCAISDQWVKCWGNNTFGQLGTGSKDSSIFPANIIATTQATVISAGSYHTCAVIANQAHCWGQNANGQLGNGTVLNQTSPVIVSGMQAGISNIIAGWDHTCALINHSAVKCWGWDGYGQLGLGTVVQRNTPVAVISAPIPRLVLNYRNGGTGSYFTVTGTDFPSNRMVTLKVNAQVLPVNLTTDDVGGFIFFIDTTGAGNGDYSVTATVNPTATTMFTLSPGAPLRAQEGGGTVFSVATIPAEFHNYIPLTQR